jgi:hypothetical protein
MRTLAVLLLVLPIIAGCGTEPSSFQGSDEALRDASTSRIESRLEGKALPDWAVFRSTGSIDYINRRGEVVFRGSSDSKPEARVVFVGREGYMGAKVDGTMYWMKQSFEDIRVADRFLPGSSGMTPDRLLKDLIKASSKVEKLGSEEIRGVATTHYRAHVDESKLESDGNADFPRAVDAWIDDQGLPRRVRVPYGRDNDAVAAVVDLFDFGVPVDVEVPPASEVVSQERFDELMQEECGKVKSAKDLEDANPLCPMFAVSLESEGGSSEIEPTPTETIPSTEEK